MDGTLKYLTGKVARASIERDKAREAREAAESAEGRACAALSEARGDLDEYVDGKVRKAEGRAL